MVKMAVFAPMPRASVSIETMVKLGDFAKTRRPYRRSCQRVIMEHLAEDTGCAAHNGRTRRPILTQQTRNARGLFQYRLRGLFPATDVVSTGWQLFPCCFAFRQLR